MQMRSAAYPGDGLMDHNIRNVCKAVSRNDATLEERRALQSQAVLQINHNGLCRYADSQGEPTGDGKGAGRSGNQRWSKSQSNKR